MRSSWRFSDLRWRNQSSQMHYHGKWDTSYSTVWKMDEIQFTIKFSQFSKTLTLSHLSTHFEWNSWEQGNTRSVCRASKSHIQTTHVVWSPAIWFCHCESIVTWLCASLSSCETYQYGFQCWIYNLEVDQSLVVPIHVASLHLNAPPSSKVLRNFRFHSNQEN